MAKQTKPEIPPTPATPEAVKRDSIITEFLDRDTATMEEADALAATLGPCVKPDGSPCWVTDFKRRNGAHPMHHGWPMAEKSDGTRVVLNPHHETSFPVGQAAQASGLISLDATNGR